MEFKIGDKIKVVGKSDNCSYGKKGAQIGDVGIIRGFYSKDVISVEFEEYIKEGHNCQGKVEGYNGWNLGLDWYDVKLVNIPNNKLSRQVYKNMIPSECGKYLIKEIV